MKTQWIGVTIISGILCLLFSIPLYRNLQFQKSGISVRAMVIDQISEPGWNGEDFCCYPLLTYFTLNGDTLYSQLSHGSSPPIYEVGDSVNVFYHPANPAAINMGVTIRESGILAGVVTLMLIVFSVSLYRVVRRRTTASTPTKPADI
jgi:hypothetical protein